MTGKKKREQTSSSVKELWKDTYERLVEHNVEFFLNAELEPMVVIQEDGFTKEWLVNSERVRDLLNSIHFEFTGEILKSAERDFFLSQIREECRRGGRKSSDEESLKSVKDALVQAILYLLSTQEVFSGKTSILLKKLLKIQAEQKLSIWDEIPVFTNLFSRRLNRLIPVLLDFGVRVVFEHREDGSYCTLTRSETFSSVAHYPAGTEGDPAKSSASSSVVKPITGSQLQHTDGPDGEERVDAPGLKETLMPPKPMKSNEAAGTANGGSNQKGGVK